MCLNDANDSIKHPSIEVMAQRKNMLKDGFAWPQRIINQLKKIVFVLKKN